MNPNPSSIIPILPPLSSVFPVPGLPLSVGSWVFQSSGPPALLSSNLPSCHPRPGAATCHPKLVSHICTFAQELRSDLHLCTSYPAPVPETCDPRMYAPANHPVPLCCPL